MTMRHWIFHWNLRQLVEPIPMKIIARWKNRTRLLKTMTRKRRRRRRRNRMANRHLFLISALFVLTPVAIGHQFINMLHFISMVKVSVVARAHTSIPTNYHWFSIAIIIIQLVKSHPNFLLRPLFYLHRFWNDIRVRSVLIRAKTKMRWISTVV